MPPIPLATPRLRASFPSRILAIVIALSAGAVLAACSDAAEAEAPALAVIDTLPGGAVRVRNPATGVWDGEPARRWRVVEAMRIGRADGEGPDVFGAIGSVVEDPLGRVWIVDRMAAELRVFDRNGAHVRTIGRKGSGPGEFETPAVILNGPDGNIWVDDARLRRWEVLDTAGVRVAGYPGSSNLMGGVRAYTPDGRLLEANSHAVPGGDVFTRRNDLSVRRLEPDGSLTELDPIDFPVLPEGETVRFESGGERSYTIIQRLPLAHHARGLLTARGEFWVTDGGGPYSIRRQSVAGDTLLIIEREYEPVPASASALETAAEELVPREGMTSRDNDRSRLPSVYPPFDDYFPATDGTLWVRRTFAPDSVGFDVFDARGVYLGQPSVSANVADLRIALVTSERIYAVARDELEVETVLVLRIERP